MTLGFYSATHTLLLGLGAPKATQFCVRRSRQTQNGCPTSSLAAARPHDRCIQLFRKDRSVWLGLCTGMGAVQTRPI